MLDGLPAATAESGFFASIVDPDAPGALRFSELVVDGDETVRVEYAIPGVMAPVAVRFDPGQFVLAPDALYEFADGIPGHASRKIPHSRTWSLPPSDPNAFQFWLFHELEEGAPAADAPDPGDLPEYVSLHQLYRNRFHPVFSVADDGVFFIQGDASVAGDMPLTGVARYEGEAFVRTGTPDAEHFGYALARITLDVDFGRTVDAVSGVMTFSYSRSDALAKPPFTVAFSADISSVAMTSNNAQTSGLASVYAGNVVGGFYGPGAAEIGGVFSVEAPLGGAIVGGFVAGR